MPAYSQSTMHSRSPSSRKFAFRRSLWHGTALSADRLASILVASSCAQSKSSGTRPPRSSAVPRYVSTTRNESNVPGIAGPSWNARSAPAIRPSITGSRIRSSGGIAPVDESCHEPALGLDERDDLRADAECCGCFGRRELDGAVDPEQAGVLPRDAKNEALPVDLDLQVVVRDPTAEDLELRVVDLARRARPRRRRCSCADALARRGRTAARPRRRREPTRRRSRPRSRCRRRARREGTRTRWTSRPCIRSRRSSPDRQGRLPREPAPSRERWPGGPRASGTGEAAPDRRARRALHGRRSRPCRA